MKKILFGVLALSLQTLLQCSTLLLLMLCYAIRKGIFTLISDDCLNCLRKWQFVNLRECFQWNIFGIFKEGKEVNDELIMK